MARLSTDDYRREVKGFIATLTLLGCRWLSSAVWSLADHAAAEFARHWAAALQPRAYAENPGPHAFALAMKDVLTSFRQAEDGRFDHEFSWAPYTLFGVG